MFHFREITLKESMFVHIRLLLNPQASVTYNPVITSKEQCSIKYLLDAYKPNINPTSHDLILLKYYSGNLFLPRL